MIPLELLVILDVIRVFRYDWLGAADDKLRTQHAVKLALTRAAGRRAESGPKLGE